MSTALSRRVFLAAGGAACAAFLAGCGAGGGGTDLGVAPDVPTSTGPKPSTPDALLASLEQADFEQNFGAGWTMVSEAGESTAVELTEVNDHSHTNPDAEAMGFRRPFSAVLEGDPEQCCGEGLYDLSHPELGTVRVFATYQGVVERETVSRTTVRANVYELYFN